MCEEYKPIDQIFPSDKMHYFSWAVSDNIHDIMMEFVKSEYWILAKLYQCDGINLEPIFVKWIIESFVKVIKQFKNKEFIFKAPREYICMKVQIDDIGKTYIKFCKDLSFKELDSYDEYKDLLITIKRECYDRNHLFFKFHSLRAMYSLLAAIFISYHEYILPIVEEGETDAHLIRLRML